MYHTEGLGTRLARRTDIYLRTPSVTEEIDPKVGGGLQSIGTSHSYQMYSCGSLAPKMRRGGCMDSAFHKPAEPWEKSEG